MSQEIHLPGDVFTPQGPAIQVEKNLRMLLDIPLSSGIIVIEYGEINVRQLKQHISVLADAIADLLPMEALIGPKLREAVENCYKNCGWDIETGVCYGTIRYPDMLCFNAEVNKICQTLSDSGPEVRSNYRGALLNRSRIFIDDVYQDIFAYGGNKSVDQMFPPDTDVIIDLTETVRSWYIATITSGENKKLKPQRSMPKNWDKQDIFVRYAQIRPRLKARVECRGADFPVKNR